MDFINRSYPGVLEEKYAIEHSDDKFEVLEKIAQSRHCLVRGNEFDTEKAAAILLDDFRNGRLGRITLEVPEAVNYKGTGRMAGIYCDCCYHCMGICNLCSTEDAGKRGFYGDDIV